MAEDDRGADRNDTPKDGGAPPGQPYDPGVLATKLAAAREQRRKVLAARAAAEGETTPAERRAKAPPFARRSEPSPPAADATAPSPRPSAAPPEPLLAAAAEPAAAMRSHEGAGDAEPHDARPSARQREGLTTAPGDELEVRASAATATAAERGAARPAAAHAATTPLVGGPPRRRPSPTTAAASTSSHSSPWVRFLAWALPLGTLAVGGALAAALVVAPAPVRQRIADVIAPDTAAPPPPTVAGGAAPVVAFGSSGRGEGEAAPERPIAVEIAPSADAPAAAPGEASRPPGGASLSGEPPTPASPLERTAPATAGAASTPALDPSGRDRRDDGAAALPAAGDVEDAAPPRSVAGTASASAAGRAGAETAGDTVPAPGAAGGGGEEPSPGAEAVASAPPAARAEPPRIAAVAEPPGGADARTTAAAAAGRGPETAAPDPAARLGPGAADTRVVLHFPPSAAATARRTAAMLRAAGVGEITRAPARFNVSRTNVRYYRPEYGDVARGVGQVLDRNLAGAPVATRDFTDFRPLPAPGTIEVWLAGSTDAPTPASATVDAAERERLEDEVTRMLRSRLEELQQR